MKNIFFVLKKAFFFNYYDSVTLYNDAFKRIFYRNFICYQLHIHFFLLFYDIGYMF